jgi:hypothetical protein
MNKIKGATGRVHDSFSTRIGARKGWFSFFSFGFGLVGGIIMRDELYYPNLEKTDDLVNHWQ